MKQILILIIALLFSGVVRGQIVVDSKEYQEEKLKGFLPVVEEMKFKNFLMPQTSHKSDLNEKANSGFNISSFGESMGCNIENPAMDSTFSVLPRNDDGSLGPIALPFSFDFFGTDYTSVYINNNGNLSFGQPYNQYSSSGFPSNYNMIAPFWADVDTRSVVLGSNDGVYFKVENTKLTVVWYEVGYFSFKTDKRNTFKVVISNGQDTEIGIGNNVAMFYGDMSWTTGDASGGVGGFGGVPATVGMNKSLGGVNCFFYQLGRFGKSGTEFIDPFHTSGVDYLDYQCFFFDVSTLSPVTLDFDAKQYDCGLFVNPVITNPSECGVVSVQWDFGDGNFSNEFAPIHSYENYGEYTIELDLVYSCGPCGQNSVTKTKSIQLIDRELLYGDSLLNLVTREQEEVIFSSALSFGGNWVQDVSNDDIGDFYERFLGIWRQESAYNYEDIRSYNDDPLLGIDGTYHLNEFNWRDTHIGIVPSWDYIQGVTQYSHNGQEKESVDALGIYSSVLLDSKGELVTAQGVNMRNKEMAFTGFESYEAGAAGNWQFGTEGSALIKGGRVILGNHYFAVVDWPLDKVEDIDTVSLVAIFPKGEKSDLMAMEKVAVLCKSVYSEDSTKTVFTLSQAPTQHLWRGYLEFKSLLSISGDPIVLDQTYAHTGRSSMKVSGTKVYPQHLLELEPNKAYHISAWMSVKGNNLSISEEQLGIEVEFDGQGSMVPVGFFRPEGPVIEGWQQVKGSFNVPESNGILTVSFKSGSRSSIWVDDIRLFPDVGNLRSFVYEPKYLKVSAIQEEENFSTLFFYDEDGNLFMVKKETSEGIITVTESSEYLIRRNNE